MKNKKVLKWFVYLMFWPVSLSYWIIKKSNWPKSLKALGLSVIMLIVLITLVLNSKLDEVQTLIDTNKQELAADEKIKEEKFLIIKKNRLKDDIDQIQQMYADLQARHEIALKEGKDHFEDEWINQFNTDLENVGILYDPETIISSEKYSDSEKYIYLALTDLDTLWKEYELNLQGKENDHSDFESFFENNINMAMDTTSY